MSKLLRLLIIIPLLLSIFSYPFTSTPWRSKVDAQVLETTAQAETEFLIYLKDQADLSTASQLKTKAEKGTYVFEQLTQLAANTQQPLLDFLATRGAPFHSYWIANMIWARGDADLVQEIASRSDVAHVYANPSVSFDIPRLPPGPEAPKVPNAIEWNIQKVGAPQVWAAGYTGQGAVIGGQDTGYDWDHPALINHYRGWNNSTVDHNYNWHDAIHADNPNTSPGNPCGYDSPVPCDDQFHGTHTMGIMVGDDGGFNQIGMAPGAKWIGCRNMEQGWGTPTTYLECYQWFVAPTDLNDQNPRPDLAPDVINNSWGCPLAEGCTEPDILLTVVENVREAGIVTVQSAGNSGPLCSTVTDPAASYDASFTVGNTTSADQIAASSSRGPVAIDGSNRLKPDISAPGTSIRSSIPGTGYVSLSGTSMAGPHVAGLVALLVSTQPALTGQVDQIETLIEQTAVPITSTQTCGGIPGTQIPNNTFGWGRIDAWKALQNVPHSFTIDKNVFPTFAQSGQAITYTIQITAIHPFSLTHNVVLTDVIPIDTDFITATLPYTKFGDLLQWNLGDLAPNQQRSVQLIVQTHNPFVGLVSNLAYGVRSNEVPPIMGVPIFTPVGLPLYFFPFITSGP